MFKLIIGDTMLHNLVRSDITSHPHFFHYHFSSSFTYRPIIFERIWLKYTRKSLLIWTWLSLSVVRFPLMFSLPDGTKLTVWNSYQRMSGMKFIFLVTKLFLVETITKYSHQRGLSGIRWLAQKIRWLSAKHFLCLSHCSFSHEWLFVDN